MLVGIHQLHYLPWLRYFEKIARCDVFVVLDNIQFNKNGWQNRNRIKTAQGPVVLTVPVRQQHAQCLDAVRIADERWAEKHLRSIEQHYRRAPNFAEHAGFLASIYRPATPWRALNDLNNAMLDYFVRALGIETRIVRASALAVPGEATERLINLIRAVGGDTYYSGAYALDTYLDADALARAGIGLQLQRWTSPVYPQLHGEYAGDLAIVDLLFNCGPASRGHLLAGGA